MVLPSKDDGDSLVLALKSIHHDLITCVRLVNVIFGFQTMLCVGITFLFTLFTLFSAYKTFYYHEYETINISLSSIYWCCFYNCFKAGIVATCNLVNTQDDVLATLIYKTINRSVCSPLVMQAFGNQVKQIRTKSSCGLFNFDYSLIMMVKLIWVIARFIEITIKNGYRLSQLLLHTSSF